MNAEELKERTIKFAIDIVQLAEVLPRSQACYTVARQLLRSGTSVGANYRSACCAKSRADFVAKMAIVQEECDETLYWMELLIRTGNAKQVVLASLMKEAKAILAIVVASIRTARRGA